MPVIDERPTVSLNKIMYATNFRVNADLIIMGARQRSFWLTRLHRGVTQDVLAQAACPVLWVHQR